MSAGNDVDITLDERIVVNGRALRVTSLDLESVPVVREVLIEAAQAEDTTTYAELKQRAGLPHAINGLGRLLDLMRVECARREEPNLAALVVTASTGEVGAGAQGDAVLERAAVYEFWRREQPESPRRTPAPAPAPAHGPTPTAPSRTTPAPSPAPTSPPKRPPESAPLGAYLGLDLAWSERNASGVAIVNETGRLLASAIVRTDDDILAWVECHTPSVAVAAVDAPLVVANDAGARPVERELTRAWGRFGAGAYPANRTNPLFNPPRGLTLAERAGWSVTTRRPDSGGEPACIEVYPHPAMVGLFGLDRVIPYKPRPRRTLESRRQALATLMRHMELLATLRLDESYRWQALRGALTSATRPVDLKRLEDELDGIFCAYLAWLWGTGTQDLLVWGDLESGFVVAPPAVTRPPRTPR